MVQKTKRTKTGNSVNTRGGRSKSDRLSAAGRKYAAGGYKDKAKMTAITRSSGGKYQSRHYRVELQRKKAKIQNQIKSLEKQQATLDKKLEMWGKKREEHYEECKKKGIYNAVTYGIIGDYDYVNKLKEPAKRQMALRHIARHNEINRKRGVLIDMRMSLQSEIYKLKQELKKL